MKIQIAGLCACLCIAGCTREGERPFTFFSLLTDPVRDVREPQNLPPTSFDGEFWVDARGCEFVRTGQADWVPRIGDGGKPMCDEALAYNVERPRQPRSATVAAPGTVVAVDPRTGAVTRVAPVASIPPTYVEVETFAEQEEGLIARKAFADLGYPIVGGDSVPPPGRALSVVLGPFNVQDALDDAISMAASLGYPNVNVFQN